MKRKEIEGGDGYKCDFWSKVVNKWGSLPLFNFFLATVSWFEFFIFIDSFTLFYVQLINACMLFLDAKLNLN